MLLCPTLPFASLSLRGALSAIRAAGYQDIDLWSVPGMCMHTPVDEDAFRQTAQALALFDVRCPVLSLYHHDPEHLSTGVRLAPMLRADTVVLAPRMAYAAFDDFVGVLAQLVPVAERSGVRLAIENHIKTSIDTLDSMRRALGRLDSANVGVCLAPPHSAAVGENPRRVYDALGGRCFVVYLWNVKCGYEASRDGEQYGSAEDQLPGSGGLDLSWIPIGSRSAHTVLMFHGARWNQPTMITRLRQARSQATAGGTPGSS